MNNKGFAITTVIYGLSILGILLVVIIMGSLSTTRSNMKALSRDIDKELSFYSKASISYSYKGDGELQQFEVPVGQSGWYRIELWGASGNGVNGGKGAYTTGIIKLTEGDLLFVKVGGTASGKVGGSTDVRIVEDNDTFGLMSRIMVAGGGGVEPGADGGTLCGYNLSMSSAGGAVGEDFVLDVARTPNYIGTLFPTTVPKTLDNCLVGSKKGRMKNKDSDSSLSGDGYYISNSSGAKSYGGSSYISGYAGVLPITNVKKPASGGANDSYRSTYINQYDIGPDGNIVGDGNNYKNYVFKDGLMLPGVKSGNGAARIEKLSAGRDSDNSLKKLPHFYNIRTIKDCSTSTLKKLEVLKDGKAANFTLTSSTNDSSGRRCVTYKNANTTSSSDYYDEIALWHSDAWSNTESETLTITYSPKGNASTTKNVTINLSDAGTETLDGLRISGYQPDFTKPLDLDGGTYYVFSILSENKVLSAQQSNDSDLNPVELQPLVGESRQKWNISAIPDKLKDNPSVTNEYSLVESTRYGALTLELGNTAERGRVIAYNKFNKVTRDTSQIWKIIPVGNGTYRINTTISSSPGSLIATTAKENELDSVNNQLFIGGTSSPLARFKFYKLDH